LSLEGFEFRSGRHIPEPCHAFPAACQHRAAIWRPSSGDHLA
jgi:hypothetical protein